VTDFFLFPVTKVMEGLAGEAMAVIDEEIARERGLARRVREYGGGTACRGRRRQGRRRQGRRRQGRRRQGGRETQTMCRPDRQTDRQTEASRVPMHGFFIFAFYWVFWVFCI
jgi:hypothetical protein